uniref:Cytochrome P450 CYP76A36 n=1 Tax=Salvia miltiorrhiza TaxID=226208 RepID=A0A0B4VSQ3_SALMI|nr:cytochrome P450 CYP76A36 [Salvia miltiorrhiza]
MDWIWTLCVGFLVPFVVLLHYRRQRAGSSASRLPPGPRGWPVFGNMFELGPMPHKTIAGLSREHGPVVWLRIGSIDTMVVQTAAAAADLFKNHDASFVERTITEVMRAHGFDRAAVSLSPPGPYWRAMKRMMTAEMLVQKRIGESEAVRRRCVGDMVEWIGREAGKGNAVRASRTCDGGGVHVARFVFLASFNMLANLMLSQDLVSPDAEEGSEFFAAMIELMSCSGQPNIVDLFPCLRWLDPQGLRRKIDRGMGKTLKIVAGFVEKRIREKKSNPNSKKDFLEVLLEYRGNGEDESDQISDHQLHIIIMEVFLAGSETTSSTIEWAMVELLSHPEAMAAARSELARVVGEGKRFEEAHIDDLPYLQAVMKETLRLHPPIPFLVPRRAVREVNFMGYQIPKNTQLFVNAWAIGRDPQRWEEAAAFKPERFLGSGRDYKGQNFELIPFGAGRRICAGIPLAHRMLHLVLGNLLHEFEWGVDEVGRKAMMDERERMGVTVRKLVPLMATPRRCSA